MTQSDSNLSREERRKRQRAFWRARYAEDPAFFGDRESDFAAWCVPILREQANIKDVVDLGCGYGRDTRFLTAQGFRVRGVDIAGARNPSAPRSGGEGPPCEFIEADALEFLRQRSPQSVDAVYSNMLFNMDYTEEEHRELMAAIHRVLRGGGLHLYSARSTSDSWYGRGKKLGPDTFDPAPHGTSMHYFSEEYANRLAEGLFTPVQRVEVSEGEGEFPIRLLYVVDRRGRVARRS
ncbi:MAG: class I SAM-dependent methyltransferase [Thermoplasmata archaeon]